MSIQTQIDRLASAKAAIKTAIEGKGVTVPDATLLDGMATLIESIEAGGCTITRGSFTPASDITYGYTITHGLGKTLRVLCVGFPKILLLQRSEVIICMEFT